MNRFLQIRVCHLFVVVAVSAVFCCWATHWGIENSEVRIVYFEQFPEDATEGDVISLKLQFEIIEPDGFSIIPNWTREWVTVHGESVSNSRRDLETWADREIRVSYQATAMPWREREEFGLMVLEKIHPHPISNPQIMVEVLPELAN